MKKFMLLMAVVLAIGFTSCSDDDDGGTSCAVLIANVETAFDAYGADPSEENCNALKAALQAGLDAGCAEDEEEEADVQAAIDSLDCDDVSAIGDCVTCAAYEIQGQSVPAVEVCEGENGNAFVLGQDLMITFTEYITLQELLTTCE